MADVDLSLLGKMIQELSATVRRLEIETNHRFTRLDNRFTRLDNSIATVDAAVLELTVELREVKHHLGLAD